MSSSAAGSAAPDFGPLAATYDRLRPVDDAWWQLFEVLVAEGDIAGRRVLDVGCGTGRVMAPLADRGATVWGVDPSEEMLREARAVVGRRGGLKRARAERLPFRDRSFDRAVLRLVVHLVDRPRAFAELARVLAPGGRAVVATFNPEHFARFWLNAIFPAVAPIDGARFPAPALLASELEAAGFRDVATRRLVQTRRLSRAEALERIRGRYISTLRLLDEREVEEGAARAERELPEEIEYALDWAVVTARLAPSGARRRPA